MALGRAAVHHCFECAEAELHQCVKGRTQPKRWCRYVNDVSQVVCGLGGSPAGLSLNFALTNVGHLVHAQILGQGSELCRDNEGGRAGARGPRRGRASSQAGTRESAARARAGAQQLQPV